MKLGLYIHIPFCKQKCMYCDFSSFSNMKEASVSNYVSALKREIEASASKYNGYIVDSIFIGGGTPTYMSCKQIKIILECVQKEFRIAEDCEISCEANPGTIDKEKLECLKEWGVNRLSIGLQSTKDTLLKKLGRIHTFDEFLQGFYLARETGFANINIDLMFGIPNQSIKDVEDTLNMVNELKSEHISAYSLIIEEGTPFFNMNENGELPIPKEDEERIMQEMIISKLSGMGYKRYEISNYAKKGFECRHNLKYWSYEEYVGFGLAAHSFFDKKRWSNTTDINKYILGINSKEVANDILDEKIILTKNEMISEYMFMGLRKSTGIQNIDFSKRFGVTVDDIYSAQIEKYIKLGLLERTEHGIRLTQNGMDFSNMVMSDMLID